MKPYRKSLQEYGRGVAGGLLFSLPMIYTMEVWWTSFIVESETLLLGVAATFLLLLGYNRFAGMRKDASFLEVVVDSVEELGLGLVLSFVILWSLDRIDFAVMNHREIIGKVVIEAMSVAIGISIGTAQLGDKDAKKESGFKSRRAGQSIGSMAVLSVCGALLIGTNLAPTEEISQIAGTISDFQGMILMGISYVLTLLVLSYIDFSQADIVHPPGGRGRPVLLAAYTYAIALVSAGFVLWFFNHFSNGGFAFCVKTIIVLGVATSLGASAGRLLLKGDERHE